MLKRSMAFSLAFLVLMGNASATRKGEKTSRSTKAISQKQSKRPSTFQSKPYVPSKEKKRFKNNHFEMLGLCKESQEFKNLVFSVSGSISGVHAISDIPHDEFAQLNNYAYKCAKADISKIKNYDTDLNEATQQIFDFKSKILTEYKSNKKFVIHTLELLWVLYTECCIKTLKENWGADVQGLCGKCIDNTFKTINECNDSNSQENLKSFIKETIG